MSNYETKDFTGVLFANADRTKDTQPNAKGSALIDGVEYWVSAWTNTSSKGVKYQSLKFERKSEVFDNKAEMVQHAQDLNDKIPF
jgi:hypothetical protein